MRFDKRVTDLLEKAIESGFIRSCVICRKPFVIKRRTSRCCSLRCRKLMNQHEHRARN